MRRVPTILDVFKWNTPSGAPADGEIPYEDGSLAVERGLADFINRGKAIRLHATVRAGSLECGQTSVAIMRKLVKGHEWGGRRAVAPVAFSAQRERGVAR